MPECTFVDMHMKVKPFEFDNSTYEHEEQCFAKLLFLDSSNRCGDVKSISSIQVKA